MQLARESFLDMSFVHKKGLVLKWKFQDFLQETVYFHHLFVLMTHQTSEVVRMLGDYYRKIKQGDLIAFLYVDAKGQVRRLSWAEKSPVDPCPVPRLAKRMGQTRVEPTHCSELFLRAVKASSNTHSNMVINFVLDRPSLTQMENLRAGIEAHRKDGAFPYICAIMGPKLNSEICVSRGINLLSTDDPKAMIELYHRVVNGAALKRARVGIECIGGELGSGARANWAGVGFNKIEKRYYGPSIHYAQDVISFIVFDPALDSHFDFNVTLELTPFTEQTIRASKTVRVFFGRDKNISTSVNIACHEYPFSLNEVELVRNPFESYALVKLTKVFADGRLRSDADIIHEINLAERANRQPLGGKGHPQSVPACDF